MEITKTYIIYSSEYDAWVKLHHAVEGATGISGYFIESNGRYQGMKRITVDEAYDLILTEQN